MTKVIKPLLATKADFSKIRYPILATPKLDGIRCLMVDGVAMSRSMKPIPNKFIQEQLKGLHGLDGELMVRGDFNNVQSAVMSVEGEPDFTFHVFDHFKDPEEHYFGRVAAIKVLDGNHPRIKVLCPIAINNEEELEKFTEECLDQLYEGAMIRDPKGKYKFGRSTVNEGILLKIKQFHDDEGTLVEFTERMHNANELEEDELGYAKRSSAKENLVPTGTAGAAIIEWQGKQFKVGFGPGIDDANKQQLWDMREELKGELVTFRYQELSKDGIPRFGKMLKIRHPDDL